MNSLEEARRPRALHAARALVHCGDEQRRRRQSEEAKRHRTSAFGDGIPAGTWQRSSAVPLDMCSGRRASALPLNHAPWRCAPAFAVCDVESVTTPSLPQEQRGSGHVSRER